MRNTLRTAVLSAAVGCFSFSSAHAVKVIGGTDILTMANALQIESWLKADASLSYNGHLSFTNVFDKADGDTFIDFHAAVDGLGPTFFVVEATDSRYDAVTQIIGGFNPVSWRSDATWTETPNVADRIAFLFNLTINEVRGQIENEPGLVGYGGLQTYNGALSPTFGGGADLLVNADLMTGWALPGTYCLDTSGFCHGAGGTNIMGNMDNVADYLTFGALEVFTIAQVPIPAAAPMLLGAPGLTGWVARRRKS
jgi:hypothetical protein